MVIRLWVTRHRFTLTVNELHIAEPFVSQMRMLAIGVRRPISNNPITSTTDAQLAPVGPYYRVNRDKGLHLKSYKLHGCHEVMHAFTRRLRLPAKFDRRKSQRYRRVQADRMCDPTV